MTLAEIEEAKRLRRLSLEMAIESNKANDSDHLLKLIKEIYNYLADLNDRTMSNS